MSVGEEVARRREGGEHLAFEVVTHPHGEDALVEHEEAGVDPVIRQAGFLEDALHPTGVVPLEGPVRGRQRHRRHRGGAVVGTVEVEQRLEVDRAQAVSVGGEEGGAEEVGAPGDASPRAGVLAGVLDADVEAPRQALGELGDQVGAIAGRQDELGEPLTGVDLQDVLEDRGVTHLQQRLGHFQAVRVSPGALATAQDHRLHRRVTWSGRTIRDPWGRLGTTGQYTDGPLSLLAGGPPGAELVTC
jgi:hypothetical protein